MNLRLTYRDLAHEMGHPWAEYWDFLDSFVDLSSGEGLRKLDDYLSKKDFSSRTHEGAGENETSNRFKTPSPGTKCFMFEKYGLQRWTVHISDHILI